jgi:hypothetical protein
MIFRRDRETERVQLSQRSSPDHASELLPDCRVRDFLPARHSVARRAAVASAPGVGAGEQKSRAWSRSPESFFVIMPAPTSAKAVLSGRRLELLICQRNSEFFARLPWITTYANGYPVIIK